MMPSAKIEKRSSAPPEKRFTKPTLLLCAWAQRRPAARGSRSCTRAARRGGSRAWADAAGAASGRPRSPAGCCPPNVTADPCGRGRRSCPAPIPARGRRACAGDSRPAPGGGGPGRPAAPSALRLDEVRDGAHHAAHRGRVLEDDRLADAPEAEAAQRLALPWTRADGAPAEPDLHHALAHGRSSATVLPRSAATAPGSFSWVSAAIVARTMLCGLFEPMHLVSTLLTPASSTTARTPPPAMTPVPADAGFSSTSPAPKRPVTV